MAWVGHWRAAATIASSGEAAGSTTRAMESSSSSKTPGAANTQLPDPMHASRSIDFDLRGPWCDRRLRREGAGRRMSEFEKANFITDRAIQNDPYPYFDWVREQGPVWREPHFGMYMITGHPEAMAIYGDPATFPENDLPSGTYSSCNVVCGSFVKFSVTDGGRRRQRPHREVPRRVAVQRPAALVRPAEPHGTPPSADAAHHTEAPQGERGLHVAVRRPPDRRLLRGGLVRDGRLVRRAVHPHGHRRPRRRARIRPLAFPRAAVDRPPGRRPQAARVPLRALQRLRRGSPPRPAQRRPHRTGDCDLPGRLDSRGQGCRPHCRQSLRRRPGDHRAPAVLRPADAGRATRPPGGRAGGPRADPQLH